MSLWGAIAGAQGHLAGSVTGSVAADEEVLPGMTIEIVSEDHKWNNRSVTTDAAGRFFTTHLAPGRYIIRVPNVDSEAREAHFKLAPGNLASIDFDLTPDAEGGGVQVRSGETESRGSGSVVLPSFAVFSSEGAEQIEVDWEPDGQDLMHHTVASSFDIHAQDSSFNALLEDGFEVLQKDSSSGS